MNEDTKIIFELEDYIRSIWQFTPIPLAYLNKLDVFMEVNPSFLELVKLTNRDVLGSSIITVLGEGIKSVKKDVLSKGVVNNFEIIIKDSTGKLITTSISARIRKDESGKIIGYFISFLDITNLKNVEQALRENEEIFRTIFEKSTNPICIIDFNGSIEITNSVFAEKFGFNPKSKESLSKGFTQDFVKEFNGLLKELKGKKDSASFECKYKSRKGDYLALETSMKKVILRGEPKLLVVSSDVTEKNKIEDIKKKQIEEKEFNQMRNQFMMRVSHELRHPLVPIVGYTSVMLEENPSSIQRKYLEKILENSNQLKDLINNVLQVTSLELGESAVNFAETDIVKLIKQVAGIYATKAELKGLEFVKQIKNVSPVVLDKKLINQMLINLLNNSVKYTVKGFIKIGLSTEKKNLIITVSDTGKGIPKEDLDILFKKHYEEVEEQKKEEGIYKGLGLGLILVRLIIQAHNGQLSIKSNIGKGTVVRVELPMNLKPMITS